MIKPIIETNPSELLSYNRKELISSIKLSEGRTVAAETLNPLIPMIHDMTNAEIAKYGGADFVIINLFDLNYPYILGMHDQYTVEQAIANHNIIKELRKITGLPIGVNLEPVNHSTKIEEKQNLVPEGRKATIENYKKAQELGFDMICLTGNPATGVTFNKIGKAVKEARKYFEGIIIAGKMHGSGVQEPLIQEDEFFHFIDNGADIVLIPGIGTYPGINETKLSQTIEMIHEKGALALSSIGSCQEGSNPQTIREIALRNKILGFDIQHIGDTGYPAGVAPIENIFALSETIRGKRITISRAARSVRH